MYYKKLTNGKCLCIRILNWKTIKICNLWKQTSVSNKLRFWKRTMKAEPYVRLQILRRNGILKNDVRQESKGGGVTKVAYRLKVIDTRRPPPLVVFRKYKSSYSIKTFSFSFVCLVTSDGWDFVERDNDRSSNL
jgi:hypothetical protein